MTRYLLPLAFALSACAAPLVPPPDASPDSAAEAAADVASAPDATADAVELPDVANRPDARPDALPDAQPDAASSPDAGLEAGASDAGVPPNINVMHPAMAVRAALRLTCGPGMPGAGAAGFCDAIKSETFEGACSVRGTRYQVAFSPFNCGLACYSITAAEDGALRAVTLSTGSGAPISGTNVVVTRGLEWVDGMGQRRQNFYVRVQLDPTPARDIRGIAGVAGVTVAPEYADVYALGCPKGP